jgi:hypothetical protein
MDFGAAFTVLFRHPKWGLNWLFVAICMIIPIVGPIVLLGYALQLVKAWHERKDPYPEFDFSYFGDYLKTGVWPFLVALLWTLILVPIMLVGIAILFPLVAAMGDGNNEELAIIVFLIAAAVMCILWILFWFLLIPGIIKSGLEQSLGSGFHFSFIKDFIGRVAGPYFLSMLVIIFVSFAATILGCIALFIGVYFAMAWQVFFSWHLYYQLYEKYLERGGQPLQISPDLNIGQALPLPTIQSPPPVPDDEGETR